MDIGYTQNLSSKSSLESWKESAEHLNRPILNGKPLVTRALGRFYTHEIIGRHLAQAAAQALPRKANPLSLRIIEPFCGDGRLVCWLLDALSSVGINSETEITVDVWDNDADALTLAVTNIEKKAKELGFIVFCRHLHTDAFLEAPSFFSKFDICITNPPWENLKPDERELINFSQVDKLKYIEHIRERAYLLGELYPTSKPTRKFSGWGTNLSRCGAEVAFRLAAPGGLTGLVLPVSILADQVSQPLRSWIFKNNKIIDVAQYVAEARLFDKVDQPCVTIIGQSCGKTVSLPRLHKYTADRVRSEPPFSKMAWKQIVLNDYAFPANFCLNPLEVMAGLRMFSRFGDLEGKDSFSLWAGRELDETGRKSFISSSGNHPFIKGRMIRRFGLAEQPSEFIVADRPSLPISVKYHRLVWRDVSRPSQKRRMQGTIIPPGWVTGNSLHVAYFRNDDTERLKALLGVINSLVFESMSRLFLATGHVSLGVVRKVPIPNISNTDFLRTISDLTQACLDGDKHAETLIEVNVAKAYGLSRSQFIHVLESFDKITENEKNNLLLPSLWGK